MKKLVLVLVLLVASVGISAQSVTSHTVQRGESIESIAQKYGISVSDLISANPDAKDYFFVGMKLSIPQKVAPNVLNKNVVVTPSLPNDDVSGNNFVHDTGTPDQHWGVGLSLSFGFLGNQQGLKNSSFDYLATLGAKYSLDSYDEYTQGLYLFGGIGYAGSWVSLKGMNITTKIHTLYFPTQIGYAITNEKKNIGLVPFIGPEFKISLSGKTKYQQESIDMKIGGKIGCSFAMGLNIRLNGFNLIGAYHLPMNDNAKAFTGDKGYFSVGIGGGF